MKFQIGLLIFCGLLSTSHAHAVQNDGYLAVVRGYYYDGTTETFKAHDCVLARWAEKEAMNNCMKEAPQCERVETKSLYCGVTVKCQC